MKQTCYILLHVRRYHSFIGRQMRQSCIDLVVLQLISILSCFLKLRNNHLMILCLFLFLNSLSRNNSYKLSIYSCLENDNNLFNQYIHNYNFCGKYFIQSNSFPRKCNLKSFNVLRSLKFKEKSSLTS